MNRMMMTGNSLVWRGFSGTEIGPFHQRLGLPNQDACHLELDNELVLIAVSDGLGSKPLSHIGSQAVCRAVVRVARHYMSTLVIEPLSVIELFHSFWLEELNGAEVEQCSCTALFAIVFGDSIFIAHIGDGDCCIITSVKNEQQIHFLTDKDESLFANQTYSLGKKNQVEKWKFCVQPTVELEACFLVTDGIADDLASEHRIDFYRELLNQYRLLSDIEVTLDVKHWISDWPVTGHSDDKTIAALYR